MSDYSSNRIIPYINHLIRRLPMKKTFRLLLSALLLWSSAADSFAAYSPPLGEQAQAMGSMEHGGTIDGARQDKDALVSSSWLLKWRSAPPEIMPAGTKLITRQDETRADVIAFEGGAMSEQQWLDRLRADGRVEYVHPNETVRTLAAALPSIPNASESESEAEFETASDSVLEPLAAPRASSTAAAGQANDPLLAKQTYLNLIGAKNAWKKVHSQTDITIALVDTGVDLNHPDLKNNLVPGVNLIHSDKSPADDNGHGTSVAGVLAAAGNNGTGVAGLLWRARIMPIKALDEDGSGDESKLGEAILYAVRKGARIVVLSVGLYRYSPYMRDVVQYAESKGVLLVAATGNDGMLLGSRAAVKYPAAYPSVLAVGGVTENGKPEARSNPGSEVDIAAPWNVYTTARGGGYKREEGTSMAAPQVAAAAALVLAQHPEFKPYEIREMLRQTAKDIGPAGVDEASGYGLLQVDQAVTASLKPDAYEPNDTRDRAALFPLETRISARLTGGTDVDWYVIDAPYDGSVTLQLQGLNEPGKAMPPVRLTMYAGNQAAITQDAKLGNTTMEWDVKKGRNYIQLQLYDHKRTDKLPYLLTADYHIFADDYESNDKSYEASPLQPRSQVIEGTFSKQGDRDWFAVEFKRSGTLRLKLSTDTVRIDPSIAVQREGQKLVSYDDNGDGEPEQSPLITVTPGKYMIRVYNAAAVDASAVTGLYTLRMEVVTKYDDPNEPNDKSYASTSLRTGTEYLGVIGHEGDEDWFQIRLSGESFTILDLNGIPAKRSMTIQVYDKKQSLVRTVRSEETRTRIHAGFRLEAGLYYMKLTADAPFDQQYYHFTVNTESLRSGYRDINGHWAEGAIAALSKQGIVSGYANYQFEPDRAVTRAEGAAMLVRAFAPDSPHAGLSFRDLPPWHWAYNTVALAIGAGYMNGYSDLTFGPDKLLTRAEMAVIMGQAAALRPIRLAADPFEDVSAGNWAGPMLAAMQQRGWLAGGEDGRFEPNRSASRAEFAALLYRVLSPI
ncbi:S8 family serine peptidase [Paenibacillus kobensis]|uniref:S8 family serine peptidase n=1 Tax=Paenibacillus kobensis TaxID=59841 RepID=UPI001FE8F1CB|nr:S8 family serine peptidase [Paenibacillus kobensis]